MIRSLSDPLGSRPLARTAAQVSAAVDALEVRVGAPPPEPGWTRCAEIDAGFVSRWERAAADALPGWYGTAGDPRTASAFVLHWYASIPGRTGAAVFRQARRVPRLDRDALAFRLAAGSPIPVATALLDDRFWCLPGDPDIADPAATVVADEAELAAVLRAQVRGHADEFLAGYRPGSRLPHRALLGAFFDALDTGVWRGGGGSPSGRDAHAVATLLGEAALVLPGGTPEFAEPSTLHPFHDDLDRGWLSRRRLSCCFYYRVSADNTACSTCPRTSATERARRYAGLPG